MLDDAPPGRVSSAPPSSVLPSAEELCAAIGPIWHYFGRSTPTDGAGALPCPAAASQPPGSSVPGVSRDARPPLGRRALPLALLRAPVRRDSRRPSRGGRPRDLAHDGGQGRRHGGRAAERQGRPRPRGPHAELRAPRAWGPAPRPLRRGERSQRVLSPEPGATPPLRVVGSRRADGDLVRRRTDAVALHAGGPAPPRCRPAAGDVHP